MAQTLPKNDPDWEIVRQILSYFVRHPKAADTAEGVANWRLANERIPFTLHETQAALEWLVARGLLQEVRAMGVSGVYRLNANRFADAARYLREGGQID